MLTPKALKIVLVSRCQPKGHGSRPGLVQSQVANKYGPGRESCDPLCAKQVTNYTGRPALDAFRYYEALARVYLRGPNPKFQKSCDPLGAKQVAYFPEALFLFPRPALQCLFASKNQDMRQIPWRKAGRRISSSHGFGLRPALQGPFPLKT